LSKMVTDHLLCACLCTCGTLVRKNLAGWLAQAGLSFLSYVASIILTIVARDYLLTNIIAALEHPDHVRCLNGKVAAVTLEPFPMLTQLWLSSKDENLSVLPSAFLRWICPVLARNPFRRHSLSDVIIASLICHRSRRSLSPYTSPWVYFTGSDGRESRRIDQTLRLFQSSTSRPNQSGSSRRRPASLTRAVLPTLASFEFRGASEYLEDLVAQIDTPRFSSIKLSYFNQHVHVFQVPQLFRFVGQTQILELARFKHAQVNFRGSHVLF